MPTFLAFPLSGLLAALALGAITDLLTAAISGAMVGSLLGLVQWVALKPLGITFDWAWATAVSLMLASPIAWLLTSYSTTVPALSIWGLVAGALVGLGQMLSQRVPITRAVGWAALVSVSWGIAWFVSANVIVDADSNYAIFGSTGAILATGLLALALNPLLSKKRKS